MILLIYFCFLFIILFKTKSASLYLIIIQIISLVAALCIDVDYTISSIPEGLNLCFLIVILTIFIVAWKRAYSISAIIVGNEKKIYNLTCFLIVVNLFTFIIYFYLTYFILNNWTISNIFLIKGTTNELGELAFSTPINSKIIVLAKYLSPCAYFMLPLHFYYFYKKRYKISIITFIMSLNLILRGVTYFSRAVVVAYMMLYVFHLILFYKLLTIKQKKSIIIVFVLLAITSVAYIQYVSQNRFAATTLYGSMVSGSSKVQDPVVYNIFYYASQWYENSNEVMADYDFNPLYGKMSFYFFLYNLDAYILKDNFELEFMNKIREIWPKHWDQFKGLVSDLLWDFGYFGTFLVAIVYYLLIKRITKKNGVLGIKHLLVMGVLFILPMQSIFYSSLRDNLYQLALFYSLLITLYLNISWRVKPRDRKRPGHHS